MKNWWVTKAWPWLKENWWAVLLLPLTVVVGVAMLSTWWKRDKTVILDPLSKADERAAKEKARRERELEEENTRLQNDLILIEARHKSELREMETALRDEVSELRQNPDKLRDLMLRVGGGQE